MSAPAPRSSERDPEAPQNIATAITEVSERASVLVREEIELAKAEVSEKVTKLLKGAIVGVAAGVFVLTALVFALVGCAWLLYYYLPGGDFTYFWGFFAMAVILLLLGALAGLLAAKAVKKGAPPTPNMAIEEARKIRETVGASGETGGAARAAGGADGETGGVAGGAAGGMVAASGQEFGAAGGEKVGADGGHVGADGGHVGAAGGHVGAAGGHVGAAGGTDGEHGPPGASV